jgi:S-adenosylmethionine:tRNA ribosyltransferase-isomerase
VHTSDFDFELPPELIAQAPLPQRDASRLLHLRRPSGQVTHRRFVEFAGLLREGDLLVLNDARVIPARLLGKKAGTGGKVELLLVRPSGGGAMASALEAESGQGEWLCLGQASKGLKPGMQVDFEGGLKAEIAASLGNGEYRVRFTSPLATLEAAIARAGQLPLPPYISRAPDAGDAERYQTVFARKKGSIAAPTAGLHFTPGLLDALQARGIQHAFVTLDVGPGCTASAARSRTSPPRRSAARAAWWRWGRRWCARSSRWAARRARRTPACSSCPATSSRSSTLC